MGNRRHNLRFVFAALWGLAAAGCHSSPCQVNHFCFFKPRPACDCCPGKKEAEVLRLPCFPNGPCYGYNSTCWHPWPEECLDCNDVMHEPRGALTPLPSTAQPSENRAQ
jgi:hypothetical protein